MPAKKVERSYPRHVTPAKRAELDAGYDLQDEALKEEFNAERRASRARRRDAKNAQIAATLAVQAEEERITGPAEPPPVAPKALGVTKSQLGGHSAPKTITDARADLAKAFEEMGGVTGLVKWGKLNPTEFYRIWARLVPKEAPTDAAKALPLEDLLAKLSQRADQSVEEAAREIGEETLDQAKRDVTREDAAAAWAGINERSIN